jgi:hypothetical protein
MDDAGFTYTIFLYLFDVVYARRNSICIIRLPLILVHMGEQLFVLERLIDWFQTNGAFFDHTALKLDAIPGQGNGAIALRDLPVSSPCRPAAQAR